MHSLIIEIGFLKQILNILLINFGKKFVLHIINNNDNVTFQSNYDDNTYVSYTVSSQFFIDVQDFDTIILNREQCNTLHKLCNIYQTSIGISESDDTYEIFVSHCSIKMIFYKDESLENNYIIPPPKPQINISINTLDLKNSISLVMVEGYVTPMFVDYPKGMLIIGDEIQTVLSLPKEYRDKQKENVEIIINPFSLYEFLNAISNITDTTHIVIDTNLALSLHFENELGNIDYYCAHYKS